MKSNNDKFFKDLADMYSEKDGERLLYEYENKKNVSFFRRPNAILKYASLAAALVIVFTVAFYTIGDKTRDMTEVIETPAMEQSGVENSFEEKEQVMEEPAMVAEAEESSDKQAPISKEALALLENDYTYLTENLSVNYKIVDYKIDNGENVFEIINDENSLITLSINNSDDLIDYEDYDIVNVNGTSARMVQKADYSLLVFVKENRTYTLTTPYDANTLISVTEQIV